jgi:hypothetical protein
MKTIREIREAIQLGHTDLTEDSLVEIWNVLADLAEKVGAMETAIAKAAGAKE